MEQCDACCSVESHSDPLSWRWSKMNENKNNKTNKSGGRFVLGSAESCAVAKSLFNGVAVVPLPAVSCSFLFTLRNRPTLDL